MSSQLADVLLVILADVSEEIRLRAHDARRDPTPADSPPALPTALDSTERRRTAGERC